jgi:hypothetical protein
MVLTPAKGQERGLKSLPTAGKSNDFTPAPPQGGFEHEGLVVMRASAHQVQDEATTPAPPGTSTKERPKSKKGMPSLNMPFCRLQGVFNAALWPLLPVATPMTASRLFLSARSISPCIGTLIAIT